MPEISVGIDADFVVFGAEPGDDVPAVAFVEGFECLCLAFAVSFPVHVASLEDIFVRRGIGFEYESAEDPFRASGGDGGCVLMPIAVEPVSVDVFRGVLFWDVHFAKMKAPSMEPRIPGK